MYAVPSARFGSVRVPWIWLELLSVYGKYAIDLTASSAVWPLKICPFCRAKKSSSRASSDKTTVVSKADTAKYLKQLIKLLFHSGGVKLVTVACLALVRTGLLNYQGQLQGNLFKTAFLKQVSPFLKLLLENVGICIATSTVESTSRHVREMLDIQWRELLTNRLHRKYFANMVRPQMYETSETSSLIDVLCVVSLAI